MEKPSLTSVQPPKVQIFYHPEAKANGQLLQIKYGLEEEGIPFTCAEKTEFPSIQELAFGAAENSVLGVGLGIDQNQTVVLHYYRLKPEAPLFILPGSNYTPELGRAMGSNAARLVKGNPFKPLLESENQEDNEGEELVKMVTKLVYQILQENPETKEVMG